MICNRINERFKHQLSENYKRMKNLKYKGKAVRTQRIRVRRGPKIEEVMDGSNNNKNPNSAKISKDANQVVNESAKSPEWNFFILKKSTSESSKTCLSINDISNILLFSKELLSNKANDKLSNVIDLFDGYNCSPKYGKGIIMLLALPLLSKGSGISLNISDEGFVFSCGKIYQLKLAFPFKINSKKADSIFDSSTRNIIIILPFHEEDIINEAATEEERQRNQKIVVSTPKLSDNYLFDIV